MDDCGWTDEDMIAFFSNGLDMQVTPKNLKEMKQDFVAKIYSRIIRDLGASLEHINQIPLNMSDEMQRYPEVYHPIGRTVALASVIRHFIQKFSDDNSFMLGDLIKPTVKRTRKFFEILIEAYMTCAECAKMVDQADLELNLKLEAKKNNEDTLRKKKQELQELKKEHAANEIHAQQEIIAIDELRSELDELQDKKIQMKEEADRIKAAISSLNTQISDLKLEILNKNELHEKLNRQVVQGNERQEAEQREHHLNECSKNYNDRYNDLNNLRKVQRDLNHCIDTVTPQMKTVLQEVQQENMKEEEECAAIADMERQKRTVKEESDDQKSKNLQISQMVSSCQEMMKQLQHSWSMKERDLKHETEQLKVVRSELMQNLTEDDIALQDLDLLIVQAVKDVQKTVEQRKEFEKSASHYYEIMMDAADENYNDLKESIENLTQKLMTLELQ